MRKFKSLNLIIVFPIAIVGIFFLSSFFKQPPEAYPNCQISEQRDGKITILFNGSTVNPYRNANNVSYIPNPDLRFGNVPGQNMFDPTKYLCEVQVTSPSCPSFNWVRSLENSSGTNNMDIKLPPENFEAVIKITYYERGENSATTDFNKPVPSPIGNYQPGGVMPYSRVVYEFEQTFQGWVSGNVSQPIYLNPSYNQGYTIDSSGMLEMNSGKTTLGDMSGLNAYIDFNFDFNP
ncbi:hypothetical protein FLGE108171_04180 [Flavobacterium gelidilacus]|jgi:hypothetical protein|uniref:hypothetical protein n=1 Tax=Flavobacterium gelidilacus TaxID=206041 RepID=UPI000418AA31|nr:hypothetical protein [Flavobacterium gelidilacus]